MKHHLPQPILGRFIRAIIEFDMIQNGDRILVGLSGGKDSLFLTYALSVLKEIAPINFAVGAFTLDPLFTDNFDPAPLVDFCAGLDIPYGTGQADIAGIIHNNQDKDPCFTCAFFRRGAVNNYAKQHGYNKVALAHHHDDAVETFYMGLLYAGHLKTFTPVTYLSRTGLTVIRPLVYFREQEIRNTISLHGMTPIASPCPLNGKTKRQEIKEHIAALEQTNPAFYAHLAAAMRGGKPAELWPGELDRYELKAKHDAFWQKN
ncbi:tRNA 2-thiocytidine biosynthesis TtcA family protein [Sporomusa acidovorans]|uniref:tRNA-cytidine(32) 2-sulfurtransferase n=1 Tax=Sporomusa acidovorans (strain ATCC 49682 / DSM 3132 / Mol) TaxID=1123286 RepID=A0ABZ3J160_SPOA4|nr:ATP-binding protein [Sporomusa acidovorans]OZC13630.1 tRNA 2-thiocytidine biosynthesis protein TtcA [Sporomusa acidovorans DSM 3132]SDE86451.1 tRNA(Ile)-lysidine synthase TilS/MesJ [Sporomusa acidovorans]